MSDRTHKARRLILHAGLPKTATTSIQNALFAERAALQREAGLYYPGNEANHTNALCTAFLSDPRMHIANKIAGRTDLEALRVMAAGIRDGLAAEIAAARADTVLFSAEGMSNLSDAELAGFRDWAQGLAEEIQVLYIVRQPLRYTTSVMQQHLKGGEILEDMYDKPPLANFRGRISNAIATFGRAAVSVRTFEDMVAYRDGVVGFFLDCVGVTTGPARAAAVKAQKFDNESLSHEAALILSSLNRQRPAFIDGQRAPMRTLDELGQIETIRGVKFYLPEAVRDKVIAQSEPDAVWLANNFGIDAYVDALRSEAETPAPTLSQVTIDSIALLLSNLINDRHVNALTQRALVRRKDAQEDELRELASEIRRITPNRPLPQFLQRFAEA